MTNVLSGEPFDAEARRQKRRNDAQQLPRRKRRTSSETRRVPDAFEAMQLRRAGKTDLLDEDDDYGNEDDE